MKYLNRPMLCAATALLIVSLAASLPLMAQQQKSVNTSPGLTLALNLQAGGSAKVTGWDRNVVLVSYDMRNGEPGDFRIDIEETAQGVLVHSEYTGSSRRWSSNMRFDIRVPRQYNVDLDSMGGGLSVTDVEGRFTGKTMGGELNFYNVRGEAEMTTMGGEIHLEDSQVDGSLKTMGGEVLLKNVTGDVTGSSMGGNVRYVNVRRRDGSLAGPKGTSGVPATEETVQISTMGGKIEVDEAPEGASVRTMGGNIDIRRASRFTRARTLGGDVYIESLDGWVEAGTNGGDVEVHIQGTEGDQHIDLSSLSGDVVLYLPNGFSAEFDLEIAFTRDRGSRYRIVSDFPIRQRTDTGGWDYSKGSPRKYMTGSGSVNGGANTVKISTINGNITIRKR